MCMCERVCVCVCVFLEGDGWGELGVRILGTTESLLTFVVTAPGSFSGQDWRWEGGTI